MAQEQGECVLTNINLDLYETSIDVSRRGTYLNSCRGGPCFILKEHLVEDLVLGGKQALVGRDLHAAHEEGDVLGQARVGQEDTWDENMYQEKKNSLW